MASRVLALKHGYTLDLSGNYNNKNICLSMTFNDCDLIGMDCEAWAFKKISQVIRSNV